MTVLIYDIARHALGTAQLDWSTQPMQAAIPVLGYQPLVASHTFISAAQPLRTEPIYLSGQAVHQAGWWQCDPISFPEAPINQPTDCVLVFRQLDGMLILALTFPVLIPIKSTPLELLYGVNAIGICRP